MDTRMIPIGTGNSIPRSKILAFIHPDSSPVKKMISSKRDGNQLIDATRGRKTRSVIVMDNGYIILSSITPNTLVNKFEEE